MLVIKNLGGISDLKINLNRFVVLVGENQRIIKTVALVKAIYNKMCYSKFLEAKGVNYDLSALLRNFELADFWREDTVIEFFVKNKSVIKLENKINKKTKTDFAPKLFFNYDNLEEEAMFGETAIINDFRQSLPELLKINKNLPFLMDELATNFRKAVNVFGNFKFSTLDLKLYKQKGAFLNEYILEGKNHKARLNYSSSSEKNISVMELVCDYFAKKYDFSESIKKAISEAIISGADFTKLEAIAKKLKNNKVKTFLNLFIEEPESNLFPTQQKKVLLYLASLLKAKNKPDIMISTHSPYVLTSINNLLFAGELYASKKVDKSKLENIIPQKYSLNPSEFNAYLIKNGEVIDMIDDGLINADVIDEASTQIMDEFSALVDLQ